MEYVTLLGAEDVQRAGTRMAGAAEEFGRHVSYLIEALDRERIAREEFLIRLEAAVRPAPENSPPKRRWYHRPVYRLLNRRS